MRSPDQNVKSSNRVHSYILRLPIGQYVEQQTDSISTLVSVSFTFQLTTTSSPLQLFTNQLYSHFFGIPEPRPRQTVPIPCLLSYFSWNARTQTSPDSPYSSQFHVSLEFQNPDLARQSLFHATFLLLMECQNPGLARQSLFQSVSRFFLFYLNLFSEPMHVCTPAHV